MHQDHNYIDPYSLLRLLYIYQGIIATRPIEMGNLEFLECMLSASIDIAANLDSSVARNPAAREKVAGIRQLLNAQTSHNAKTAAPGTLALISAWMREDFQNKQPRKFYCQTQFPALPDDYEKITILFGPGLGLGDQITFCSFVNWLSDHCPDSKMTIYTLYPGLWRNLTPKAREVHYRHKPLRPFRHLAQYGHKELVIVADFDNFSFHHDPILSRGRDVLEVALGKCTAWLNQYDSPWIKAESFSGPEPVGHNYSALARLADRLFPLQGTHPIWQPARALLLKPSSQRRRRQQTIFLNPFTSKKYHLTPEDWYQLLTTVHARLKGVTDLEIVVFPGLNKRSQEYANRICMLCHEGRTRIPASLLRSDEGNLPSTYNTFDLLSAELPGVDLCITVDTFTGHLMPLYKNTTIVITDRDNRAFWVPCRWNHYCLLDTMKTTIPELAAHILVARIGKYAPDANVHTLIAGMSAITDTAIHNGISREEMHGIQQLLFEILNGLPDSFPYQSQGHSWLVRWGQLSAAASRDPIPPDSTISYVQSWQQCEFYKFINMMEV